MRSSGLKATAQLRIRRPVREVYEAFVDPDVMTRFWFPKSSGRLDDAEIVEWRTGEGDGAVAIEVRVKSLEEDARILVEWGAGGRFTSVEWTFEPMSDGTTFVRIEESGFAGTDDEALARALDSTAGFNLVIAAAKAFLEHGVELRVVEDHAPPAR